MATSKKRRFDKKLITFEHQTIKELRLELGLTLKQAGKKQGVSEKTIGAIENGRITLDKKRIEEIVKFYNLSYFDFIRTKKLIQKEGVKKRKRTFVRHVLSNSDRRSYQKLITKECKFIKSMRRMKNLSQYEASELCGYSKASIGHIENGRIELTKERIQHIIESYGYKYKDLEDNLGKEELRDQIIDTCIEKINQLDDSKLSIVKSLLGSL